MTRLITISVFLLLATPALAQSASIRISTNDLDLASDAGKTQFDQRVNHAVDRICGSSHSRSTWEQKNYADCSRMARSSVATQVAAAMTAAENARQIAGGR